jgi:hypothetical protein
VVGLRDAVGEKGDPGGIAGDLPKMLDDRRRLLIDRVAQFGLSFPAPAIAQNIRELKMVTAWPKNSPGLQTSAERLAQLITVMSQANGKSLLLSPASPYRPNDFSSTYSTMIARARGGSFTSAKRLLQQNRHGRQVLTRAANVG